MRSRRARIVADQSLMWSSAVFLHTVALVKGSRIIVGLERTRWRLYLSFWRHSNSNPYETSHLLFCSLVGNWLIRFSSSWDLLSWNRSRTESITIQLSPLNWSLKSLEYSWDDFWSEVSDFWTDQEWSSPCLPFVLWFLH